MTVSRGESQPVCKKIVYFYNFVKKYLSKIQGPPLKAKLGGGEKPPGAGA